mgnify:CR=1 FL=1
MYPAGNIPVIISPAGTAHGAVMAELHGACFDEPWTAAEFLRLMAMPGAFAKLASQPVGDEDQPVGFALARAAGGECEIITIGVVPSRRGIGIGDRLMAAIAADGAALGFGAMFLEVAENNHGAQKLYASAGYEIVWRRKGYYRTGDGGRPDAIVMRRHAADFED